MPSSWQILSHKVASNLSEQKAVIRPILKLLKGTKIIIIADREFHSIFRSHWLKTYQKQDVPACFETKKINHDKTRQKIL